MTGHTGGIGKCIYDNLSKIAGCEVVGFSRSTGHNIADAESIQLIAEEGCDVFINNAFNYANENENDDQLNMLKCVYEKHYGEHARVMKIMPYNAIWRSFNNIADTPLIVNIGSVIYNTPDDHIRIESNKKYKYSKMRLKDYASGKRIADIRPGLIHAGPTLDLSLRDLAHDPIVVYDAVKFVIDAYAKGVFIYEMEVG